MRGHIFYKIAFSQDDFFIFDSVCSTKSNSVSSLVMLAVIRRDPATRYVSAYIAEAWARTVLALNGDVLDTRTGRDKWWSQSHYNYIDSKELSECGRSNISGTWIDANR